MSAAEDAAARDLRPRVAVACDSRKRQRQLRTFFASRGIDVVASGAIGARALLELGPEQADVLLVDLASADEQDGDALHELMSRSRLPLLFNEAGTPETGHQLANERELLRKIRSLARSSAAIPPAAPEQSRAPYDGLALGRRAIALAFARTGFGVSTAVLVAAVLGLAALVAWEVGHGPAVRLGGPRGGRDELRSAMPTAAPLPAQVPLSQYQEIVARPLFYTDRQTPQPPGQPQASSNPPTVAPPNVQLLGIVITENGRQALIRELPSGQMFRAQAGATVQGWTIDRIEAEHIVLKGQGQAESVPLRVYGGQPGTGGPNADGAKGR
jgi:hypothetical protein